jgi:hypothetical protein
VSGAPAPRLRLAHSVPAAPVAVATNPAALPASGDAVLLLAPLSQQSALVARARAGRERMIVQMSMPGIGSRFLVGVVRAAAGAGWAPAELAALAVELELRCTYVVVAPRLAPLDATGSRFPRLRRAQTMRFADGVWSRAGSSAPLLSQDARAAAARAYTAAAARSGVAPPRALACALAELAAAGVPVGMARSGMARSLGVSWAVELLTAPPLAPHQLQTLRDRFASASRCDWCGLPVVGRHCRRCTPAERE